MDTKLKNGNKARKTGIFITVLASVLFVALFPEFKEAASKYLTSSYDVDMLEDEAYIKALIESNYILYKNVKEKSKGVIYTYEDLYLEESLEDIDEQSDPAKEIDAYLENGNGLAWKKYGITIDSDEVMDVLESYASQIQEAVKICEAYAASIGVEMDYYVLDKTTGTYIKNTSLPIESLLSKSDDRDAEHFREADEAYDYYVIMDYNESGYLQNVSVRGTDADQLLKTVQMVESSYNGRLIGDREEIEYFSVYDEKAKKATKLLTIAQKKPVNATFIYAITPAQLRIDIPTIYGYYGTADITYSFFLLGILAVTMLLALCRPALLVGKKERKLPFEAAFAVAIILWGIGTQVVLELVMNIMEGHMRDGMERIPTLQQAPLLMDGIETGFAFCVLAFLFGSFYFCCLELSDMIRGRREYFQTRSFIWRLVKIARNFFAKAFKNLKTEVINADLGDDMTKLLRHLVFINFCILATASLLWFFGVFVLAVYSLVLYFLCKKYMYKIQTQYEKLLEAANSIAQGRLNNTFEEDFGVFDSYKEALYNIQDGFKAAVEEEVKSQKMKTELITNVSHDLKTPLTAIITYIDLLKEENITKEQQREYLDTLERKSLRLKVLIEDLFEVSKTNSGNVHLEKVSVDIGNLMRQAYLEQEDKMKQAGLLVRFAVPEEKIILNLDSQKTYRIFENLYVNIIKYALPSTRVFITLEKKEDGKSVRIELKNISAQELVGNPQDLTERFVRGDDSRNTEGSGLGLAIARGFTEVQGGSFRVETDGDLFKVVIEWSMGESVV